MHIFRFAEEYVEAHFPDGIILAAEVDGGGPPQSGTWRIDCESCRSPIEWTPRQPDGWYRSVAPHGRGYCVPRVDG